MLPGQSQRPGERDWVEYSARVFAMSGPEQQALYAVAARDHEAEQSAESALTLAILTMILAESPDELLDAAALTEFAVLAGSGAIDDTFVSLLDSLIREMLNYERSIRRERGEKQALQAQLDALRRLEQELNAQ